MDYESTALTKHELEAQNHYFKTLFLQKIWKKFLCRRKVTGKYPQLSTKKLVQLIDLLSNFFKLCESTTHYESAALTRHELEAQKSGQWLESDLATRFSGAVP